MTVPQYYFIEPFDVLFLRGNRLFGDTGSFGESLMPPWPSVASGAIRSALIAERGYDPAEFARGRIARDPELGTPESPGSIRVSGFNVARRYCDGQVESLYSVPVDLAIHAEGGAFVQSFTKYVYPVNISDRIRSSAVTRQHAVLAATERGKLSVGQWLNSKGWRTYLSGDPVSVSEHIVERAQLWMEDTQVGIALDRIRGSAEQGSLFTSRAVVPHKLEQPPDHADIRTDGGRYSVGFLAEVSGATAMPQSLTLRLGGDGRAARAKRVGRDVLLLGDDCGRIERILDERRCRIVLTTPGFFTRGWLPNGCLVENDRRLCFELCGVSGRLVCAAVPRPAVISGFDLARRCPKPAQRIAPAGSVYWLDNLEASEESLLALLDRGLWSEQAESDTRRVEGFNCFEFAEWSA